MILDTLVNQLNQRLQYEKRAQVCLWFDERRGFARTLDALDAHLGSMIHAPFSVIAVRRQRASRADLDQVSDS